MTMLLLIFISAAIFKIDHDINQIKKAMNEIKEEQNIKIITYKRDNNLYTRVVRIIGDTTVNGPEQMLTRGCLHKW